MSTGLGVELAVDPQDWYQFKKDADAFDKNLTRGLRKELKAVGNEGVQRVIANLAAPSPDGGPDIGAMRELMAAATKASVSFAKSGGSVRVKTSARGLPEGRQSLVSLLDLKKWRHPLFGNDEVWMTQRGSQYFTRAFNNEFAARARTRIDQALKAAIETMKGT